MPMSAYDPFARGPLPVGARTLELFDAARGRRFPCEAWLPGRAGGPAAGTAAEAALPLVVYSHPSGHGRRAASSLCEHLAAHGYAVAAMDHSELVAPELARREGEAPAERAARARAMIESRVPDIRFLLDRLLAGALAEPGPGATGRAALDGVRVGLVGHSFGGWTVLAVPEVDARVRAVVAIAPAGSSRPRPGILPAALTFDWGRDVPTLFLVAEDDVMTPLDGQRELFERTRSSKRMVVLRRADHGHFIDHAEREHEALRATTLPDEAAWIPAAMRPFAELCPAEKAARFARGLTLAHLDAELRGSAAARHLLDAGLAAALAAQGIDAYAHVPGRVA